MIKYTCLCQFTGFYNGRSMIFEPGQEFVVAEPVLVFELAVHYGWAKKEFVSSNKGKK